MKMPTGAELGRLWELMNPDKWVFVPLMFLVACALAAHGLRLLLTAAELPARIVLDRILGGALGAIDLYLRAVRWLREAIDERIS